MTRFAGRSTLRLVQSISTIPKAFPTTMNTCGRICVHKSGRFVVVSNRGHQSITVYRVKNSGVKRGELKLVGQFHTRGETPRHFQFDASGQYLLVANQDTDSLTVFNFNLSNGQLKYSGNEYKVSSPNFICCCPSHQDDFVAEVEDHESISTKVSEILAQSNVYSSDSEESTEPVKEVEKGFVPLDDELARARQEIAELKALLATKV